MPGERRDTLARILRALERQSRLQREIALGVAREHGISRASLSIVRLLDQLGEAGVGDLAHALRVDVSVASRQLSELVGDGIVERTVDGDDRRARSLRLTSAGRAVADDIRASMHRRVDEAFGSWSTDELAAAAATLEQLVQATALAAGCPPAHAAAHARAHPESPPVAAATH